MFDIGPRRNSASKSLAPAGADLAGNVAPSNTARNNQGFDAFMGWAKGPKFRLRCTRQR